MAAGGRGQRDEGGAFDTRADAPPVLTGRASKGIARHLRDRGFSVVVEPESFLGGTDNHLQPGEEARARVWGGQLAMALFAGAST